MSLDENKALVQRLYDNLFNHGRLRLVDELIAADFIYHAAPEGTPPGREGVRQVVENLRQAFPDCRFVIEDLLAEDDKVVVRLTFTGTHAGLYRGIAPTGRRVTQEHIHILRIEGERGAELWVSRDSLPLLTHLGARLVTS